MTIEETKELIADNKNRIATMQAYVDGKQIQYFDECTREWEDILAPSWLRGISYRVKPEPKYRPFKDADECWQEMLKHEPFGWVCTRKSGWHKHINILYTNTMSFKGDDFEWDLSGLIDDVTFADGAPFGVKED